MAKGKIRASSGLHRISDCADPYIDLLRAIFEKAAADTKSKNPKRHINAASWLGSPEIRQLALVLDINLPDPTAIAAVADHKRRNARKEAANV